MHFYFNDCCKERAWTGDEDRLVAKLFPMSLEKDTYLLWCALYAHHPSCSAFRVALRRPISSQADCQSAGWECSSWSWTERQVMQARVKLQMGPTEPADRVVLRFQEKYKHHIACKSFLLGALKSELEEEDQREAISTRKNTKASKPKKERATPKPKEEKKREERKPRGGSASRKRRRQQA